MSDFKMPIIPSVPLNRSLITPHFLPSFSHDLNGHELYRDLRLATVYTIQSNAQRWRPFSNKPNYQLRNSMDFFKIPQTSGKHNDQDVRR